MTAPRATARRLPPLAGAIGAVLLLAACTGAPDAAPSTASPSAASPSASAPASASGPASTPSAVPSASASAGTAPTASASGSAGAAERYLGFVQQFSPTLQAVQPAVLVQLGQQVCSGFRSGRDSGEIAVSIGKDDRAPGLDAGDVAVILGAAVATLCPQYRDALAG